MLRGWKQVWNEHVMYGCVKFRMHIWFPVLILLKGCVSNANSTFLLYFNVCIAIDVCTHKKKHPKSEQRTRIQSINSNLFICLFVCLTLSKHFSRVFISALYINWQLEKFQLSNRDKQITINNITDEQGKNEHNNLKQFHMRRQQKAYRNRTENVMLLCKWRELQWKQKSNGKLIECFVLGQFVANNKLHFGKSTIKMVRREWAEF